MPISPDPNRTAPFTLDSYASGPVVFQCRFLTKRQRTEIVRLQDEAINKKSEAEAVPVIRDAIAIGVVGWDRPEPFSVDEIDSVLTEQEMWQLLFQYPGAVAATEFDLKKSVRQSQPDVASSSAAEVQITAA